MGVKLVDLDFDGTLTDILGESGPVIVGYKSDLKQDLGCTDVEVDQHWERAKALIRSQPSQYGWRQGSRMVVHAQADPYILAKTVTEIVFDEFGLFPDESQRQDKLRQRYHANIPNAVPTFREDTDQFLSELEMLFDVAIVTNSSSALVEEKLRSLPTSHPAVSIVGGAKKFELDDGMDHIPLSIEMPGFGRPLYARRKRYWDVLQRTMAATGASPEQVAVIGDIYEFDILLPQQAGFHTVLVQGPSTLPCELAAAKSSARGYTAQSLMGALELLKELR